MTHDRIRLDYPRAGEQVVVARRGSAGKVVVRTPGAEKYDVIVGTEGEPFEETGLLLAFTDARRTRRHGRHGGRTTRGRNGSGPDAEPTTAETEPPAGSAVPAREPDFDDPWI